MHRYRLGRHTPKRQVEEAEFQHELHAALVYDVKRKFRRAIETLLFFIVTCHELIL